MLRQVQRPGLSNFAQPAGLPKPVQTTTMMGGPPKAAPVAAPAAPPPATSTAGLTQTPVRGFGSVAPTWMNPTSPSQAGLFAQPSAPAAAAPLAPVGGAAPVGAVPGPTPAPSAPPSVGLDSLRGGEQTGPSISASTPFDTAGAPRPRLETGGGGFVRSSYNSRAVGNNRHSLFNPSRTRRVPWL